VEFGKGRTMLETLNLHSPDQIKELFRRLRLCAPSWIDMPLDGISEAADMAEEFVKKHPTLFWNTPPRQRASDATYVDNAINRLKVGGLDARRRASQLIMFL
jgi:hypothetical protein